MRIIVQTILSIGLLAAIAPTPAAEPKKKPVRTYVIAPRQLHAIENAVVPDAPLVKPERPRKVLVYGRVYTHPESVACCFKTIDPDSLARRIAAAGDFRVERRCGDRGDTNRIPGRKHKHARILPRSGISASWRWRRPIFATEDFATVAHRPSTTRGGRTVTLMETQWCTV
jgi:hypothetical protein